MVLVYEYMAKGNLKEYLSGKSKAVLSWEQRLQIAIDAAQALEYLHNGCNPPIIHRDVKTENIFLNEKLQARVADFGWSRSMTSEDGSHVSATIVGTLGYLDPDYPRTSVANEKTDVYSFGIVLLELISGRPAIIKMKGENPCNIAAWIRPIIAKGDISMIFDPRLEGEFETYSAGRAVETAMLCVSFSPTDRPTMSGVVEELKECLKIKVAHERRNIGEQEMGPVAIETEVTFQESLDGELYDSKTSSYEDVTAKQRKKKKKKEKRKKSTLPATNSITSVLVGTWKRILQQAPDKSSSGFGKVTYDKVIGELESENMPNKSIVLKAPRFSYSEVEMITRNFEEMIGAGGSSLVFSGHLSNGLKVAVKKLFTSVLSLGQFENEAQLLTTIHHRNLVSLIGYCIEGPHKLLIYEYMANGNVREHLEGEKGTILSWEQRLGIATNVAKALEYLHEGCSPAIIHRDVKAANILLNRKMEAKLADLGWSRSMLSETETHVSTTFVVGTSGYLDPQYGRSGKLTQESDVYSFGIVLLELISGRPPKMGGAPHILNWVDDMIRTGNIEDIVDPRLRGTFHADSAWRAVETAMSCCVPVSSKRKTMRYVVKELEECLKEE